MIIIMIIIVVNIIKIIIIMIVIIIIIQGDPISLPESAELSPPRVAHIFYTVLSREREGESKFGERAWSLSTPRTELKKL